MTTRTNTTLTLACRDWLQFVRGRHFLIVGLISPFVLTAILWILIFANGDTSADGTDGWKYFQSELKRFGDDITGKYDFEKSENIVLFYVVDHTDLDLDTAVQQEILKRDLTSLIAYLKNTPYDQWQWFGNLEEEIGAGSRYLRTVVSKDNFTAQDLISMYSLEHDKTFSSRLTTTEKDYSWFVEGWNDNIVEIAQAIPEMSFNRAILVINTHDAWIRSAWVPAYIEIPSEFRKTLQATCFVTDSKFFPIWAHPDVNRMYSLQEWFEELVEKTTREFFQDRGDTDDDQSLGESEFVSLDLRTDDALNTIARKHERTRHLSSFTFISLFLLFIGYAWCLLQFDPSFKPKSKFSVIESATTVMDGRALGTMLKIVSIAGIWFVLLLVPEFLLVGTNPVFGVGALAVIFNPINLLNYFLFFLLGLWTICYTFDALRLFAQTVRSLNTLLIMLTFTLILNSSGPGTIQGSVYELPFLFFPLIASTAMVSRPFGYPDILTHSFVILAAIGYLIGFRFFIERELKLQARKLKLEYRRGPR